MGCCRNERDVAGMIARDISHRLATVTNVAAAIFISSSFHDRAHFQLSAWCTCTMASLSR